MMYRVIIGLIIAFAALSCGGNRSVDGGGDRVDSVITEAKGIIITHHKGYTEVEVKNPWKDGAVLQTYLLVPRDSAKPDNMPKGTVVRTPLKNALVYSSVHGSVIKELGELASIKGVCDAQYFNMQEIQATIKSGKVVDAGSSMSPTIEKVIAMSPDAIILSPFQNAGYGALSNLGIPIIECADYMENTPLARAEWIKLFGELYGKQAIADSIFNAVKSNYMRMAESVSSVKKRPKVISEYVTSGVWYMPGGNSYMAHFFADAGAAYPWADDKSTGSLSLDFAQVLNKAADADIWLIKTLKEETYTSFGKQYSMNEHFKAFKEHHIYQCCSLHNTLFQDFPFHPEVLLQEYIHIFHPDVMKNYKPRYYTPLPDE